MINPKQKEFFNEHAAIWDKISVHNLDVVEHIASLLELDGTETILDVGTGTGIMIPYYERCLSTGSITALDYSEKMIDVAKMKYPEKNSKLTYLVADLYDLHLPKMYDVVVCYSCFPHFVDKPKAMEILSSTLKKNGKLMISHGCSRDKINNVHKEGGVEICNDYLPDLDDMIRLFNGAGLLTDYIEDNDKCYIVMGKKI